MATKHPNLVLEWRLDGNANDTGGNGLHGIPQQMSYDGGLGSLVGVFVDTLPGSQVARLSISPTTNMTVCCFAQRSSLGEAGYIFAFGNPPSERRVNLAVVADDQRWATVDSGIMKYGNVVGDMTAMTHFALVVTGQTLTLFANGTHRGSVTLGGLPLTTATQLTVGGRTGLYSQAAWLNGRVARFRVYNAALVPSDIRRDMLGLLPMRRY